MAVLISRCLLDRILAEAARAPTREVCGLLLGEADRIAEMRVATNVSDRPASNFELDPRTLFEALRAERVGGPRMIGHYHSHPGGVADPSPRDAEAADDLGRLWLIVADGQATLWRAVVDGPHLGRFERVELEIKG